jgi:ankyrin repeat protein
MYAARKGFLPTIECLVAKGAELEARNSDGNTALHLTSRKGWLTSVKYLLQKGANMQAKNNAGDTALHLASKEGHSSTLQYLVEKGGQVIISPTFYAWLFRTKVSCKAFFCLLFRF